MSGADESPAAVARGVVRRADRAVLATVDRDAGGPYASLVLAACDHAAAPLLLLSDLAEHTANIGADPRVSLLFDGTAGLVDPLTGPRAGVLGRAQRVRDDRLKARFLARHPSAAGYAGFGDFAFYRVSVERVHLVAGFGKIDWITADDFLFASPGRALAGREPDIVAHMNADHADAIDLYAGVLLARPGSGWRMTGIDPEGCDLRREGEVARLPFDEPVHDAESARKVLVRLAKEARR